MTPSEPDDTALYQRGFNDGYLIAKHAPELSAQLADVQSNSPRMEGMKDGQDEYLLEQSKIIDQEKPLDDRAPDLEIELE
ncbi:MAG: hypothetical protein ACK5Z2_03580 [Bacteroidota bacterium]